jgi:hypothetical protein
MSREWRYWLFFVIVAVGLALSWGQIGRKTHQTLEAQPVSYLAVEQGCMADRAPCAALAGDHALVLGPSDEGLRLEQTGLAPAAVVSVEATALNGEATTDDRMLRVDARSGGWLIGPPPPGATGIRVRVVADGRASVADFALAAPQ